MVLAFAKLGADVVIASRKLDECEKVAKEVRALGRKALPISVHVAKWEECDKLFKKTMEEYGRCDVLVNKWVGQEAARLAQLSTERELWLNLAVALRNISPKSVPACLPSTIRSPKSPKITGKRSSV